MKIQAIIPTAGVGKRLKANLPKPFVLLNGRPILVYTLEAFQKCSLIDSIIVVGHKNCINQIKRFAMKNKIDKVKKVVVGGQHRWQSVSNGLKALDKDTEIVVIHDGARPFIDTETIRKSINLCKKSSAITTAVPVKPTIKKVDSRSLLVKETLDRKLLWEIQTPQVFKKNIIIEAHQKNHSKCPTDDASMVENIGYKVKIFEGKYKNIKITTHEDLIIAKAFLKS